MISYAGKKVLVRGIQSGVYFGELVDRVGQEVELKNVRNLWAWHGANTLLDVAENGVEQKNCRFSNFVENIVLTDVCEIVPCSDNAISNIEGMQSWIFQK